MVIILPNNTPPLGLFFSEVISSNPRGEGGGEREGGGGNTRTKMVGLEKKKTRRDLSMYLVSMIDAGSAHRPRSPGCLECILGDWSKGGCYLVT